MSIRTCRGLIAGACATIAMALLPAFPALGSSPVAFDPQRVPWSLLVFQASQGLTSARSEITLAPVATTALKNALHLDAGVPLPPLPDAGAMVMTSTIGMSSKLPFVADKTWKTRVWFLPGSASALQRTRTKTGEDPDRKAFRYLPEGVWRLRFKPESAVAGGRQPGSWTTVKRAFYPYGPSRAGCSDVSDPSLLLYILSAVEILPGNPPVELCVFNKKTLYRVELRPGVALRLPVHYTRLREMNEESVEREIDVRMITISSHPVTPAEQEPEPFEFFEMRGDIEVSVDAASGLPVRVRGTVKNVGEATFHLIKANLVR